MSETETIEKPAKRITLSDTTDVFLKDEEYDFWKNLKDTKWRLNNLYFITNKQGQKIKFKMNWAQEILYDQLWFFSLVLKARQLGITTFFSILYLDQVLFKSHKTAGIIAHTDKDTKIVFERIKFAYDNLPEALKENIGKPNTDSSGELSFPNGSKIFVARSTRGGTVQYLHISEFGKICAQYPAKAKEIVTGAINSVEKGCFVSIESTAEGRSGYFFDYCQDAQNSQREGRKLTELDFRYFFFPWWQHPDYRLKADFVITKEYEQYFDDLLRLHNISLDDDQKRWYISKKKTQKDDMMREYPSTADEAFAASIEGAYFKEQMKQVYEHKRITNVSWDSRYPVNTFWDLGMNDENCIVFTQSVGNEIRFIDEYSNHGEGLAHYVNKLREKPYTYGMHHFPHDVEVRNLDATGKSRRQTLIDLGIRNIKTVERSKDINDDIEQVRKLFSRFWFNEATTTKLVNAMNGYRKDWDEKLGEFKNYPRHDKSSHWAAAVRILATGWTEHYLDTSGKTKEEIVNFF